MDRDAEPLFGQSLTDLKRDIGAKQRGDARGNTFQAMTPNRPSSRVDRPSCVLRRCRSCVNAGAS